MNTPDLASLVGVPTAGYVWGVTTPPAFIKATDGPGGATSTAQFTPGFAGGSHWEVVVIEAVAAGEGEITLAQRRPWEDKAEPDASTVTCPWLLPRSGVRRTISNPVASA